MATARSDARTGLDFGYPTGPELPLSPPGIERSVDRVRIRDGYSNLVL
jgi:hypothetical protein